MRPLTRVDWDIIDARVQAVRLQHKLKTSSQAFLWRVLDQEFPDAASDHLETITDGADDRGVDAIRIIDSDETARVVMFQAKYRDSTDNTTKTINLEDALKCTAFLNDVFSRAQWLEECRNVRLMEAVRRIWLLHTSGTECFYEIIFCSNDAGLSEPAKRVLEAFCQEHPQVTFRHYGPHDLIRDTTLSRRAAAKGALQVIGREVFERSDGDVRGLVAAVDATSFVEMITADDRKSLRRELFDDNLRVFLGTNAGYNASIISTASSPESYLFWYLNNGITVTCKKMSYNKGHINPTIILNDFQIVNGAQTSHSLVEARDRNPEALANVVLTIRVYETDRQDIIERVAIATNSQARIQDRDLKANRPILKKLEVAFAQRGYFLERKRNQHADKHTSQRLDVLKLGQIITSFYLREPDRAKTDSDDIFGSRFNSVFHDALDVDELVRIVRVYDKIEWLREDFLSRYSDAIESSGDYQYLVYGHWFILYAFGLLTANSPVPDQDSSGELIEDAISLVARACGQQKQVAHYQLFRSARTKEKILAELMGKQGDLFLK